MPANRKMPIPVKALQLILFTVENNKIKTLLDDLVSYHPVYRAGDIIHLLPFHQTPEPGEDQQYVVCDVRHTITVGETGTQSTNHLLLVEVAQLIAKERDDLGTPPDYLAALFTQILSP